MVQFTTFIIRTAKRMFLLSFASSALVASSSSTNRAFMRRSSSISFCCAHRPPTLSMLPFLTLDQNAVTFVLRTCSRMASVATFSPAFTASNTSFSNRSFSPRRWRMMASLPRVSTGGTASCEGCSHSVTEGLLGCCTCCNIRWEACSCHHGSHKLVSACHISVPQEPDSPVLAERTPVSTRSWKLAVRNSLCTRQRSHPQPPTQVISRFLQAIHSPSTTPHSRRPSIRSCCNRDLARRSSGVRGRMVSSPWTFFTGEVARMAALKPSWAVPAVPCGWD